MQYTQHAQGHDQRRNAQKSNTETIEQPEERPGCQTGDDGWNDPGIAALHHVACNHRTQRHDPAHGEINSLAPAKYDQVLARCDHPKNGRDNQQPHDLG